MTDVNDGFGADDPHDGMLPVDQCILLVLNVGVCDQENVWRETPLDCMQWHFMRANITEVILEFLLRGIPVVVAGE